MRPHKRSDAELGHSQKIVSGLEAFDQVSNVKPGPERSEGPALQVGPSGHRGAERSEGSAVSRKSSEQWASGISSTV